MKKLILLFLFLLSINIIQAQTVQRRVLFESFTSSTCGPCATNNPYLDNFLNQFPDSIVCVRYHMGWPSPGNDPMYLHNTVQNYDRRYYYGVNSIPYLRIEGMYFTQSYSNYYNMWSPYSLRLGIPTPLNISVSDSRLSGDTIQATVVVTNLSNLPAGNYYLRVQALEKNIKLTPQPNGEANFFNVFRKAFPNSQGTSIPSITGTYTYIFKYKVDPVWVSDQMFTIAFVQEDITKEIFNSAKGVLQTNITPISDIIPMQFKLEQNYPNPFNPVTKIVFSVPKNDHISITIIDALGREVYSLINNEFIKAGIYKTEFNGSNLSSGIYFYKMASSTFVDTKKMILVK
jgi:hypothetical protein